MRYYMSQLHIIILFVFEHVLWMSKGCICFQGNFIRILVSGIRYLKMCRVRKSIATCVWGQVKDLTITLGTVFSDVNSDCEWEQDSVINSWDRTKRKYIRQVSASCKYRIHIPPTHYSVDYKVIHVVTRKSAFSFKKHDLRQWCYHTRHLNKLNINILHIFRAVIHICTYFVYNSN